MNSITLILGAAIVSMLAGCSTTPVTLDRVGPSRELTSARRNDGDLVVYSAWRPLMNLVDPDTPLPSDYTILSSDGTAYRKVRNWVSKVMSAPASVSLPTGLYAVEADAADHGKVRVPVLIEAHRTTIVHLDGEPAGGFKGIAKSRLVSLPDGYVVGWRAR